MSAKDSAKTVCGLASASRWARLVAPAVEEASRKTSSAESRDEDLPDELEELPLWLR